MEITTLFKACVKTVRTTNKMLELNERKSNIHKTYKDNNLDKAKLIAKKIGDLHSILQENKPAYLNVLNYLSTNKTMTELDRQKIDALAEGIITQCRDLLSEYKKELAAVRKGKQKEEHYQNVIETLNLYLRNVSKLYTEAKAILVKRVIEAHKISKLETLPSVNVLNKDTTTNLKLASQEASPSTTYDFENQLSAEDMQMFEAENELLYNELNSFSDEVKQMESKVVHIAELQELFTEKVLQQEKDIERIATTVVGSTEHMKDANDQIRQAIQRNAGLRVWVLFFLLVMSFSLLFLDWYND